jgi:hypothetical protein
MSTSARASMRGFSKADRTPGYFGPPCVQTLFVHMTPAVDPQQSLAVLHLSYAAEHVGASVVHVKAPPSPADSQNPPQHWSPAWQLCPLARHGSTVQ